MKMIVCGSRTWGRQETQRQTFNHVMQTVWSVYDVDEVINGGASGADTTAAHWCLVNKVPCVTVKAEWDRLGPAAGPMRNQQMLEMGPGLVVAFVDKPLADSRGSADMVSRSRGAYVPTWVIEEYDRR